MFLVCLCSGPHIGARSDIRLWHEHGPLYDMTDDEAFLADKGYVGGNGAVTPRKKPVKGELSQQDSDYNDVLGFVLFLSLLLLRDSRGCC